MYNHRSLFETNDLTWMSKILVGSVDRLTAALSTLISVCPFFETRLLDMFS